MTATDDRVADVYDTACAYVNARHAIDNADTTGINLAVINAGRCWHDLALAVDDECRICDPGTCPGEVG